MIILVIIIQIELTLGINNSISMEILHILNLYGIIKVIENNNTGNNSPNNQGDPNSNLNNPNQSPNYNIRKIGSSQPINYTNNTPNNNNTFYNNPNNINSTNQQKKQSIFK
jgi:hypothetical protein